MDGEMRLRTTLLSAIVVALVALSTAPSLAHTPPDSLIQSVDRQYPTSNGEMVQETPDSETSCVSVGDSMTWSTPIANGTYHLASHGVTVVVDLDGADGEEASSGTGLGVHAAIRLGNGTELSQDRSIGANQQVDRVTFDFQVEESDIVDGEGAFELEVGLSAEGDGPLDTGQDAEAMCGQGTYVETFDVALGPVGAEDADCDGVPDVRDDEIGSCPGSPVEDEGGAKVAIQQVNAVTVGIFGFAAAGTAFGAGMLPLADRSISARKLHLLLGLSAGLLLTVGFVKMLPRAIALNAGATGAWIVVGTFFGLLLVEWMVGGHGHDHSHEEDDQDDADDHGLASGGAKVALIALIALSVHRFVGGMSMPAAFGLGDATGVTVVGAIMLHQIPDGLAAASLFLAGGWSRGKVIRSVAGVSLWVPFGALAGIVFINFLDLIPQLLAISAGTFLYIATIELIPEIADSDHRLAVAGGFVVGIVLAWALVVQLTQIV